jgi:aspartate/methionine/tyrosine aminotransferase
MMMKEKIQESYISIMSNKVKQFGGINLAQGLPGFAPPAELIACLQEVAPLPVHQYPPATGNFALVDQIQKEYRNRLDLTAFKPLMTCGATEAISLIYNYLHLLIRDSYSVMAFNPAYESYRRLPELYCVPFVPFGNLDDTVVDFDLLEKEIVANRVKIFFLSSHGNPHGRAFSSEDIDRLLTLSLKHRFFLVVDDVYSELYFNQTTTLPLQDFHPYCFLVNSFSKRFSITGWRVGFLYAHESHFLAIKNLHDYTGLCVPSVLQEALSKFIAIPNVADRYVDSLRKAIVKGFDFYKGELQAMDFHIPPIDGGYFVWTRLPEPFIDGVEFAEELYRQQKVAVVPGIHFSDDASRWIRINIARPFDELNMALKGIKQFIKIKQ